MEEKKVIFGAFDGMSCGQIAINKIGITDYVYYASEIDKYAMSRTQVNYPNTIQVGDIRKINAAEYPTPYLFMGGSPCQSFSFAGKRKGMSTKENIEIHSLELYLALKEQGFEFIGQSYLFWEFVRLLRDFKPKYFLLENVMMGKKWQDILTKAIGVEPICINSARVSGQNRKRLYWTNIPGIQQPEDKGILLRDILEPEVDLKYFLNQEQVEKLILKINTKVDPGDNRKAIDVYNKRIKHDNKSPTLTDPCHNSLRVIDGNEIIVHNMFPRSSKTKKGGTGHLTRNDGKTYCLATTQVNVIQLNESKESGGKQPYQQNRVYDVNGVSPALCRDKADLLIAGGDYRADEGFRIRDGGKSGTLAARARTDESCGQLGFLIENNGGFLTHKIRKLTPIECERLQTVPDDYTYGVSDSQRYKMLGNGWTVDVIAHILSYIKE